MAGTPTPNYNFIVPTVGADNDLWGGMWNLNIAGQDKITGTITTTGSGAAYVLTSGQSITAYATGQTFRFKASFTNNAAATLNVDALGAKNIVKNGATATVSGDIVSGYVYTATYDGTAFQVSGPVATSGFLLAANNLSDLASASTARTNLGLGTMATQTASAVAITGGTAAGLSALSVSGPSVAVTINSTNNTIPLSVSYAGTTGVFIGTNGGTGAVIYDGTATGAVTITATLVSANIPAALRVATSAETSGTLTTASANRHLALTGNVTMPASVFTGGDKMTFDPGTSSRTFTRGASLAMYVNGVDSASATLASNQIGGAHYRAAGVVVLTGAFT